MKEMWTTPKGCWYWSSEREFHYIIFGPKPILDEPCLSVLVRNRIWIDQVSNYHDRVRGLADKVPSRKWTKINLFMELR